MTSIKIEKLEVYKISAGINSSAKIWVEINGQQKSFYGSITAGESFVLGPFINITRFDIEYIRDVTIEKVFDNFSTPVKLVDYVGAVTINVTPGVNITLNAGNAPNQRIVYKDSTGGCGSNNVTLNGSGCTIDGLTSYTLKRDYQTAELIWDGVSNWRLA